MSRSILAHIIPKITQAEPAATRALHHLLDASDKVVERFVALVESEPFDIGRIGSEWVYAEGVRPDLAIHDAATGEVRIFVENKFRAWLTDYQPVAYLRRLPEQDTRRVKLLLEPSRTALPAIPVVLGARQILAQLRVLTLQLLDAAVPRIPLPPGCIRVIGLPRRAHTEGIGSEAPHLQSDPQLSCRDPLNEYDGGTPMQFTVDRTISLGDLATSAAIVVSAGVSIVTFSCSWSQDRELLQRQQADQVRNAAADTLAKLERWREISVSLFDIVQPSLVEASEGLVSDRSLVQIQRVRDRLYASLINSRLSVHAALRDEEIETAYVYLFGYRPTLRDRLQQTLTLLKEKEVQMFERLQGAVEQEVSAYLRPEIRDREYMTATLGNALRRAVAAVRNRFEDDASETLASLEVELTNLVRKSDTQLLAGQGDTLAEGVAD